MIDWHRPATSLILLDRGKPDLRPDGHKSAPVDLSKTIIVHEGCATRGTTKEVSQILSQALFKAGLARYGQEVVITSSESASESERAGGVGGEDSTDFDELDRVETWPCTIPATDFPSTAPTKVRVTFVDSYGQIYGHAYDDRYVRLYFCAHHFCPKWKLFTFS